LEYISFSHGSTINLNNIARECQTSRKIVENYISILEDLLLAYKLPVFNKRAKREPISTPKFYLFDAGVYNALRPKGPLDRPEEINGIALEGLILQHLRAWCDYSTEKLTCYFWRTRGGAEVDFIVYGQNHFYAIEVKHSSTIHSTDLRSLKTFQADYPEATPLVIYRGPDKILIDNIVCWPAEEFLLQLYPNQWPA
jgi:predicted AAA+ superfamily ATPase